MLYIVATPIGNLEDMTFRAIRTLKEVDYIFAEDTRVTKKLLDHYEIKNTVYRYDEHTKQHQVANIINLLKEEKNIALVTDAGTPCISDPGYEVVDEAHKNNIKVVAIPGASALTASASIAGISMRRFCFEGFLPAKSKARKDKLENIAEEDRTLIFYESTHRILDTLADMQDVLGGDRYVVLAREITKTWETIAGDKLSDLRQWLSEDPNRTKGEMVLIVEGKPKSEDTEEFSPQAIKALTLIAKELPLKKASAIVAELYGYKKNALYQFGLDNLD